MRYKWFAGETSRSTCATNGLQGKQVGQQYILTKSLKSGWAILNYNKQCIWLFDSTCIPLLKMSYHNTFKLYNAFFLQEFYVLFATIPGNLL